LFLFLAISLSPGSLPAQHSYTPADVVEGGRLFRANCTICHGPDGNFIPGVHLGRGIFKRAASDTDLVGIIRNGIPGTPMPPSNYSEFQATTIVAYLRSMAADEVRAAAELGDAQRGKAWYDGPGQCATCHRIKGVGSRLGPDLTEIGVIRRAAELERSLLDPDAEVLSGNRSFQAVTRDGGAITGTLLNQDAFSVQILDATGRLVSLAKADLRQFGLLPKSTMPSYRDKLGAGELADLVGYLASLKGVDTP
jgi:putative heme-binding domain-containing protein